MPKSDNDDLKHYNGADGHTTPCKEAIQVQTEENHYYMMGYQDGNEIGMLESPSHFVRKYLMGKVSGDILADALESHMRDSGHPLPVSGADTLKRLPNDSMKGFNAGSEARKAVDSAKNVLEVI